LKGLILAISVAARRFGFECVEGVLQPQEIALRQGEEPAEAEVRVGGDAARAGHDGVNAVRRDADRARELVLAEARRLQKLMLEDIARMGVLQQGHHGLSS